MTLRRAGVAPAARRRARRTGPGALGVPPFEPDEEARHAEGRSCWSRSWSVVAAATAGLAACAGAGPRPPSRPARPPTLPAAHAPGPAAGTKMAPGLYDLEDGSVVAVGTVEHRDLEGGFWAVIGGSGAEGDAGRSSRSSRTATSSPRSSAERRPLVRGLRRTSRRRLPHDGRPRDIGDASCSRRRPGRPSSPPGPAVHIGGRPCRSPARCVLAQTTYVATLLVHRKWNVHSPETPTRTREPGWRVESAGFAVQISVAGALRPGLLFESWKRCLR